jgi:predicted nucleic acid-binding protein
MHDEPGADVVERLVDEASRLHSTMLVTSVNFAEVWHVVARVRQDADDAILKLRRLGFTCVDVDWEVAQTAAALRLKYKLSYLDCCGAALAKLRKLELVACDYEFKVLEREIKIRWLKGR